MKTAKGFFVLVLGLGLVSTVSFTVFSDNARALSAYDNVIVGGGNFEVSQSGETYEGGRCNAPYTTTFPLERDISASWVSDYILNPDAYVINSTSRDAGIAFWQDLMADPDNYAWSVSQSTEYPVSNGNPPTRVTLVITASKTDRGAEFVTAGGYPALRSTGTDTRTYVINFATYGNPNPRCDVAVANYYNNYGKAYIAIDPSNYKAIFINYDITYPSGYDGEYASQGTDIDSDEDGVNLIQESQQGTSDNKSDSDGDGIDDLKESQWYTDRDDVYCNTSTPKVCSYPNPTKQDVYLEIDWMDSGFESFKPDEDKLQDIVDAFSAKNKVLHIDTGNLGGGNELPSYEQVLSLGESSTSIDFYDFKYGYSPHAPNFNPDRQGVWRYLISGYKYEDDQGSSGQAVVGGEDIFISYGLIKHTFNYSDLDTYVTSTIMHELGHNLCLTSNTNISYVPSECIFEGVDSDSIQYLAYPSAMMYIYQGSLIDYSSGQNALYDHNDWGAIGLGMGIFSGSSSSSGESNYNNGNKDRLVFDPEHADANEMTPEKSKDILKLQQENGIAPDDQNQSQQNPEAIATSQAEDEDKQIADTKRQFDVNNSSPNELTKEQSRNFHLLRMVAPYVISLAVIGTLAGIYLLVKNRRNIKIKRSTKK